MNDFTHVKIFPPIKQANSIRLHKILTSLPFPTGISISKSFVYLLKDLTTKSSSMNLLFAHFSYFMLHILEKWWLRWFSPLQDLKKYSFFFYSIIFYWFLGQNIRQPISNYDIICNLSCWIRVRPLFARNTLSKASRFNDTGENFWSWSSMNDFLFV